MPIATCDIATETAQYPSSMMVLLVPSKCPREKSNWAHADSLQQLEMIFSAYVVFR
jgi:hypothetical protein